MKNRNRIIGHAALIGLSGTALLCLAGVPSLTADAGNLQEINGSIYSVESDGSLGIGWIPCNGCIYYFNPADGKLQAGWVDDNGTWYYCDEQGRKCGGGYSPDGRLLGDDGALISDYQEFTPDQAVLDPVSGMYEVTVTQDSSYDPYSWFWFDENTWTEYYPEALPLTDYATLSKTRNAVFNTAVSLIGTPYLWGGSDPSTGLDCSGFVMYTLKTAAGVSVPHTAQVQMGSGKPVTMSQMRPGDVLYFGSDVNNINHAAMYAGNGWILQTVNNENGECVNWTRLRDRSWPVAIRNQLND